MWYIYNRPIGHYLDMHMETAGQNNIPGKIYMVRHSSVSLSVITFSTQNILELYFGR